MTNKTPVNQRTFQLNSGYKIPVIGLGTWLSNPSEVAKAVEHALKYGYRHVDGAAIYLNENEVGDGIKASGVPRNEIFVTSKLWNTNHDPKDVEKALDKTLEDLQLDYIDLYLVHWPMAFESGDNLFPVDPETGVVKPGNTPIEDTWKAVENLVATGKVKSIGVSNFNFENLQKILSVATIKPAVNQIEAHPLLLQPELFELHKKHNIIPTAYSSLGNSVYRKGRVIDNPKIIEISKKLNKDPASVILSFLVQIGFAVIPKSITPSRIESNFELFELPQNIVDELWNLDEHRRYNDPVHWGFDIYGEQGGHDNAFKTALHIANKIRHKL